VGGSSALLQGAGERAAVVGAGILVQGWWPVSPDAADVERSADVIRTPEWSSLQSKNGSVMKPSLDFETSSCAWRTTAPTESRAPLDGQASSDPRG